MHHTLSPCAHGGIMDKHEQKLDCVVELSLMDGCFGTLKDLAKILVLIEDTQERTACSILACDKFRDWHWEEMIYRNQAQTLCQLYCEIEALKVAKAHEEVAQVKAEAQKLVEDYMNTVDDYVRDRYDVAMSDKIYYPNKNKKLRMQESGQVPLIFKPDEEA